MNTESTNKPRFTDYVRPLWARKWLILIAVVLATGGVYAYYARQDKVYTSGTLVYVKDPGDPVSGIPSLASTDRSVQNQASLLHSADIAQAVDDKIHFAGSPDELLTRISVDGIKGEDFVKVSARGDTPREAADIANAYARQFVKLVNSAQSSRIERALELSRNQFNALPRGPASQGARATLGDQIRRLQLALEVPAETSRQVDVATPPASPSSPKPVRNALFALVLTLLIAGSAAFALERFDRRLKRPEEIEGAYGRPLLAVLPHTGKPAPMKDGVALPSADFREPFRVLRTNIELSRLDDPPRTIVVSSAVPGEGKSTVVRNLALAFHETGKRVAVVDADLRHPALPAVFGAQPGPGLTEVLTDGLTLDEVVQPIGAALPGLADLVRMGDAQPVGSGSNGHTGLGSNGGGTGEGGSVTLLLSGAQPANPAAVLASERVARVFDELRDDHDVVLIDTAPLLAVTDTVPLLRYADAAVIVGRLGFTSRDTARRLAEFLGRIPDVGVLGIVANDLSHFEARGFGYGYGYGYGRYGATEDALGSARQKQAV